MCAACARDCAARGALSIACVHKSWTKGIPTSAGPSTDLVLPRHTLLCLQAGRVSSVALSFDEAYLLSAALDGSIYLQVSQRGGSNGGQKGEPHTQKGSISERATHMKGIHL